VTAVDGEWVASLNNLLQYAIEAKPGPQAKAGIRARENDYLAAAAAINAAQRQHPVPSGDEFACIR
jgi:hypothetical protein